MFEVKYNLIRLHQASHCQELDPSLVAVFIKTIFSTMGESSVGTVAMLFPAVPVAGGSHILLIIFSSLLARTC
jgi:hypothetical protein